MALHQCVIFPSMPGSFHTLLIRFLYLHAHVYVHKRRQMRPLKRELYLTQVTSSSSTTLHTSGFFRLEKGNFLLGLLALIFSRTSRLIAFVSLLVRFPISQPRPRKNLTNLGVIARQRGIRTKMNALWIAYASTIFVATPIDH